MTGDVYDGHQPDEHPSPTLHLSAVHQCIERPLFPVHAASAPADHSIDDGWRDHRVDRWSRGTLCPVITTRTLWDHWSHPDVEGASCQLSAPPRVFQSAWNQTLPGEYYDCWERSSVRQRPPHCLPTDPMLAPSIPFPGTAPQMGRLYSLSTPDREATEPYISNLLESGIIRPSSLPAGAGYFFEEKKVKTLKPCTDYRGLNDITIENCYPLPLILPTFELLQSAPILPSYTSITRITW